MYAQMRIFIDLSGTWLLNWKSLNFHGVFPHQNTNIFRGNIDIAQTDFEMNQADFSEKLFHFQGNVNIFPTNKKTQN